MRGVSAGQRWRSSNAVRTEAQAVPSSASQLESLASRRIGFLVSLQTLANFFSLEIGSFATRTRAKLGIGIKLQPAYAVDALGPETRSPQRHR